MVRPWLTSGYKIRPRVQGPHPLCDPVGTSQCLPRLPSDQAAQPAPPGANESEIPVSQLQAGKLPSTSFFTLALVFYSLLHSDFYQLPEFLALPPISNRNESML